MFPKEVVKEQFMFNKLSLQVLWLLRQFNKSDATHTFMNNHTQQPPQSPHHAQNLGYPYFLITCASFPLH
jgi:hypothetical protein